MSIIYFKIKIVVLILYYMFRHVFIYAGIRLFNPSQVDHWIQVNLLKWAKYCLDIVKIKSQSKNKKVLKEIDWTRNVFFVANHQSSADIPVLLHSSERSFGFVAKYELSRIPFLKYWMEKIGCVFINRTKFISAIRTLKKLEDKGQVCHLAIFPEGTRCKTGNLEPFKMGVLKIAWQIDAVLIPSVIIGTRNGWENRRNSKKSQEAEVHFLPPVDLKNVKCEKKFPDFLMEFEGWFRAEYQKKTGQKN